MTGQVYGTSLRRKRYLRLVSGTALVLCLAIIARRYQIPSCANIQSAIHEVGVLAPALFLVGYVLGTVAFFPGVLLTLIGGLAFGPWWGTLLVSVASLSGAVASFVIGRYLARDVVEALLARQPWFKSLSEGIQRGGFSFVLFVRLVPLFPFNALNYACGVLPLRLRDFFIGSLVGMLPATFAYVYLGAAGCRLIDVSLGGRLSLWDMPEDIRKSLFIAVGLLGLLSVSPVLLKVLRKTPWERHNSLK